MLRMLQCITKGCILTEARILTCQDTFFFCLDCSSDDRFMTQIAAIPIVECIHDQKVTIGDSRMSWLQFNTPHLEVTDLLLQHHNKSIIVIMKMSCVGHIKLWMFGSYFHYRGRYSA